MSLGRVERQPGAGARIGREAFARLLLDATDVLWRLSLHLTGEAGAAERLVERTVAGAWAGQSELPTVRTFLPWVLGRAIGLWEQDGARSAGQTLVAALPGDAYERARSAGYAVDDDPAAALVARLDAGDIQRAMGGLRPEERAVTALSLVTSLGYEELGLALGLPTAEVRGRLQRGRAALKLGLWQVVGEK